MSQISLDNVTFRVASVDDAQALLDIYAYYVNETAITFEYNVPRVEEFQGRIRHTLQRFPYIVAELNGIVGGQIPVGAGLAFADKYFNTGGVTMTYFGDGAARQGSVHEAFNMAMLWKLPVVFIVENNGYAMGTSVERTANHTDIWKLGLGYEMPCGPVDGMNPVKVAEAMTEAIERARRGDGPTFLEMKTYRYRGHSMSDAQLYRSKEEVEEYKKIDPITQVLDVIKDQKYATDDEIEVIEQRVKDLVEECAKFAEESPYPEIQQLYDVVYEQEDYPFLPHKL